MNRLSKPVFVACMAVGLGLLGGGVEAQQCGARVIVRQVGMKANEDGTRTLKYRAKVDADKSASQCTKVSFTVMRSYIRTDGQKLEDGIPVTLEARERAEVEGEDILATSKLVYWWADRVSCEPCAGQVQAQAQAKTERSGTQVADDRRASQAGRASQ